MSAVESDLIAALELDDASVLEQGIDRAIEAGTLVSNPANQLVPNRFGPWLGHGGSSQWKTWRAAGFRPVLVKRADPATPDRKSFDLIVRALRDLATEQIAPVWVTPCYTVSLLLPQALDLRTAMSQGPEQIINAHRVCMTSLETFLGLDVELRDRLKAADLYPASFDAESRYLKALKILEPVLGRQAVRELGTSPLPATDVKMLFLDPKPANFIYAGDPDTRPEARDIWRVDLDLMPWLSSVTLQVVIAYFANPVRFETQYPFAEAFADHCARAQRDAERLGAQPGEFVATLKYHLVRNLSGAVAEGSLSKLRSFAEMLAAFLETGATLVETASVREALQRLARTPLVPAE